MHSSGQRRLAVGTPIELDHSRAGAMAEPGRPNRHPPPYNRWRDYREHRGSAPASPSGSPSSPRRRGGRPRGAVSGTARARLAPCAPPGIRRAGSARHLGWAGPPRGGGGAGWRPGPAERRPRSRRRSGPLPSRRAGMGPRPGPPPGAARPAKRRARSAGSRSWGMIPARTDPPKTGAPRARDSTSRPRARRSRRGWPWSRARKSAGPRWSSTCAARLWR